MSYEDFQAKFMKENRKLRLMMGSSLVLFVAILILLIFDKKYFVYSGHPLIQERVLAEAVCLEGFKSIASGEPDSSTVSSGIIEILNKEPFEIEILDVLKLESLEKDMCKLIIKAEERLMAFKIGLATDSGNPFYYKVLSIDELANRGDL